MSFSAQYEVLKPYLTDRIISLVRSRLLEGLKFFRDDMLCPDYSRTEVKLVLLLVQIANPKEYLNANELAILERGKRISAPLNMESSPSKAGLAPSTKKSKIRG